MQSDALEVLAAAVPDDLAERAGKVLEPLSKLADDMDRHATDEWDESELICSVGNLIRSLLARIAAMEATIKGLEDRAAQAEQDAAALIDKALAAETALAAERDKVAKLVEALIWCSGSEDFQDGGYAREGWLNLCAPLIHAALQGEG